MKMIKKLWLKFLRPFYTKRIISSLSKLIVPFYVIYFLSIWLNLWQIALIWSFRSIVSLISEIPTWTIADLYWKKISVILWVILSWLTVLFIPFFHSFVWICIIFCINALTETLFSWSDQAWVSDVIENNDSKLMDSYFSRSRSISNFWFIIAWVLASIVAKYFWYDWLWFIYGIWTIITGIVLCFAENWKKWYEEEWEDWIKKDFWIHIKSTFKYIAKNKTICLLFLWIALFYIIDELTGLIRTPYIQELWIDINNLWFIYWIIGVCWIVVPLVAEKVLKRQKNSMLYILWACIWMAILLVISSTTSSVILIIWIFVIYNFIDDFILPIDETITNKVAEKSHRSTILSTKSMVENLACIVWWPLAWVLLWYISYSQWLLIAAGLMVIMGVVYYLVQKRKYYISN